MSLPFPSSGSQWRGVFYVSWVSWVSWVLQASLLSPGGMVPIPRKLLHNNLTDLAPKHLLLQVYTGAQGRPLLSSLYRLGSCSIGVWCFPRTCRDWHEGCCYSHAPDAALPHIRSWTCPDYLPFEVITLPSQFLRQRIILGVCSLL